MSKKRDRLELVRDILMIIRDHNNSIKPTPLLRYSNLSSQRFSEYLKDLLDKKLVKEINDKKERKHITLTDKGFRYLERYKAIKEFVDEFDL